MMSQTAKKQQQPPELWEESRDNDWHLSISWDVEYAIETVLSLSAELNGDVGIKAIVVQQLLGLLTLY